MGKSVEELRRILERMQKDLERHPTAIQPPPQPFPARVDRFVAPPQPTPVEAQPALPKDISRGAADVVGAPAQISAAAAAGRGSTSLPAPGTTSGTAVLGNVSEGAAPGGHIPPGVPRDVFGAFDAETLWTAWKSPRALLWGATILAVLGIVLQNLWIVALGFLGLPIYALFSHTGDGNLNLEKIEDLSQRIAILERRLASRSLPSTGGASQQAMEELEELRVMVRSLYRVLQGSSSAQESAKKENAEDDD